MNGAQDLGGMHGFGPIEDTADEVPFHAEWERRAFALTLAMGAAGRWNIDMSRAARESLPPAQYLSSSYYQIWLAGLEKLLVEAGLVTADELASGTPKSAAAEVGVLRADNVAAVLAKGGPTAREIAAPPAFAPGDKVRARNMHPVGHTRIPRYVRSARGVVERHHGAHVFPDANAAGNGEAPQHCYSVRFAATELWGADADPRHSVNVDLWESYLEPA